MEPALVDDSPQQSAAVAAGCPVAHRVAAPSVGTCPFPHTAPAPVQRSRADLIARRLLRIRAVPAGVASAGVTSAVAYATFRRSMMISATRCTLTYVFFPFVMPAIGFATGVGPVVGILIGTLAICCDVFTIRRFFTVDHKYRWQVSVVALSVISLLMVLLVQDFVHLLT